MFGLQSVNVYNSFLKKLKQQKTNLNSDFTCCQQDIFMIKWHDTGLWLKFCGSILYKDLTNRLILLPINFFHLSNL